MNYISNILDRPNVVFVRYEDMVSDPISWARAVSSIFGFEGPEQSVLSWRIGMDLASKSKVDREDRWLHKRQIAPGDHERKLRAKTIDQLNDVFGDVLTRLGYSSP